MDTAATDPVTPAFNLPKPVPASSGPLASSTSGLPRIKEENQDPPESNEADSDNVEEDEVELTGETDDGDRIPTSAKRPYIPPLGRRPYGFPKIEGLSEEDADVLVKQFWHERRVEKKVNGGQCVKSARQKYRDKVEQEGKLPFSETQYVKAVMKQYKTKTIRKAEFEFQWFASLEPSHPLYCPEPSLELEGFNFKEFMRQRQKWLEAYNRSVLQKPLTRDEVVKVIEGFKLGRKYQQYDKSVPKDSPRRVKELRPEDFLDKCDSDEPPTRESIFNGEIAKSIGKLLRDQMAVKAVQYQFGIPVAPDPGKLTPEDFERELERYKASLRKLLGEENPEIQDVKRSKTYKSYDKEIPKGARRRVVKTPEPSSLGGQDADKRISEWKLALHKDLRNITRQRQRIREWNEKFKADLNEISEDQRPKEPEILDSCSIAECDDAIDKYILELHELRGPQARKKYLNKAKKYKRRKNQKSAENGNGNSTTTTSPNQGSSSIGSQEPPAKVLKMEIKTEVSDD